MDEWKIRPHRPDNHWLDCLVGCAAAASVCGAILFGTDQKRPVRKIMKLSELQKRKAAKMARQGKTWGESTG